MKCQMSREQFKLLTDYINTKIKYAALEAQGLVTAFDTNELNMVETSFELAFIHFGPAGDDGMGPSTDWVLKQGDPAIHEIDKGE